MLFTWDTTNLCIVFEKWHIYSTAGLLFSLLAVVLIGMGYEALRAGTRRYEIVMSRRVDNVPSESTLSQPPPPLPPDSPTARQIRSPRNNPGRVLRVWPAVMATHHRRISLCGSVGRKRNKLVSQNHINMCVKCSVWFSDLCPIENARRTALQNISLTCKPSFEVT